MAITDRYGLEITTSSAAAAERFQDGMDKLLSYNAGAEDSFSAALETDPRLSVAHTGLALLALVQGDAAAARAAAGRARDTVADATRRERQHVEALSALIAGETGRGLGLVDEHVAEFPRDAVLVNQAGNAIALAGRSDREEHREAFMERLAPAYGDDWWYQSALAFTYHEVDRFEESRRLSERSLEQYPRNANAVHNLAHITFETLETESGAAFLEDWMAGYDRRASFHCHLAWHSAMFELHRGRYARALEIFERDILGGVNPRSAMTDGTALLWRVRLDRGHDWGPDQASAWRALADIAGRVSRPGFLFGEIHAALAYAACGDHGALARLVDGLKALDAKGHPIAGRVALPLVQGTAAFAVGDHAGALAHFEPVEAEMHRMGGSHAQWEIFEETMVACYLVLERYDDASRLVRRRLARRASPRDLGWLDRADAGRASQQRSPGDSR
jgi:tetratricopeptide (TPR) repeat protein